MLTFFCRVCLSSPSCATEADKVHSEEAENCSSYILLRHVRTRPVLEAGPGPDQPGPAESAESAATQTADLIWSVRHAGTSPG